MYLEALRNQALGYLANAKPALALRVFEQILVAYPEDIDTRMRVGDICVQLGRKDLAQRVFAGITEIDMLGGRPLHALVALHVLEELGLEVGGIKKKLAALYCAGSPRIARVGARIAPPRPNAQADPPILPEFEDPATALEAVAAIAADPKSVQDMPEHFQPVPLLSEISEAAFLKLMATAVVHRAGHRALLIRQGDPGDAFYMLASGRVRVFTTDKQGQQADIATLHEGAIFGEMALINAQPRSASVEAVGSADVIEIGAHAIRAAASEIAVVAAALERFTRERLVRRVLGTSALFRPFSEKQRHDLVGHFTAHTVEQNEDLIVEDTESRGLFVVLGGEVQVLKGAEPFESELARLGPGECFGEISLLRDQPAVATVRATRRTSVLLLSRHHFQLLIQAVPDLRTFFEEMTEDRLRALEDEPLPLDDLRDVLI